MPDPDPRDLWPDAGTLEAGDEGLPRDDDWPRARPYQEDGHLSADAAYRADPPDADYR